MAAERRIPNRESRRWDDFAGREPLYAVLTHDRYLSKNLTPRVEAEFFESGEQHVARLFEHIRERVGEEFVAKTVLEYGCGPGRLALAFARRVQRVVAVDVSPKMLDRAREFAARQGATNIDFLTPEQLPSLGTPSFDLVSCHLLFQRLPRERGLELLARLLDMVGEVGVFHFAYGDGSSAAARYTRAVRRRVPLLNAAANFALRKAASTPLIPTTLYDLAEVFDVFRHAGFVEPYVALDDAGVMRTATFYVKRRAALLEAAPPAQPRPAPDASGRIDVRQLVRDTPLGEWNRRAEEYFKGLGFSEHHLAKPFANIGDTPGLLVNLAVLLQGMRLVPGLTVLDYGAGTGWLSRFLTQLGARAILLDVSPSALEIARETFRRLPIIGERPEPQFLVFDGEHIDLPNGSVDRIICFDAFHHAPNPDHVLREFGRILRPGGIAAFAEPGPAHSQAPQSQFEMRTYGVLENDIDLPAIWHTAQTVGFTDVKVAAFNIPPFHLSLSDFHDLLDGGPALSSWADSSRDFMRNAHNFFLYKGGEETIDSRRTQGLRADIRVEVAPAAADRPTPFTARVANAGDAVWLPASEATGGVSFGCHLYDARHQLLDFEFGRWVLGERGVQPDEAATLSGQLKPLAAGEYILEFDCVAERVAWFGQVGSNTVTVRLQVG